MIASVKEAFFYSQALGIVGLAKFIKYKLTGKMEQICIKPKGIMHGVWLRIPSSDVYTYRAIMLNHDYLFKYARAPRVIVDAGANIGLASVFLASQHPAARIIAIEPEAENFHQLLKNVSAFPNRIPIQAALWNKLGEVDIGGRGRLS